ncbi:MAG: carbohydrate ABC transporter permease [Chloroflexota bacterium]
MSASSRRRRRRASRASIGTHGCMIAVAVFFMVPILFMVIASFKPERVIFEDLQTLTGAFLPNQTTLDNYRAIFDRVPIPRFIFNSLFITITTVGLGLITNSMLAFALSRIRWKGRGFVLVSVLALAIVPVEAFAVPLLVLVNELPWIDGSTSWLDSLHVQIIPFIADAFSIFLFYQFFAGIPKDFDEAAKIDGAGYFSIYRRIIVPMSRPVFATVAILQAVVLWNSYLWPLMVTRSEDVRPLTIGITAFYTLNIQWGQILAFATIVTIPIIIIFVIFERWFVRSAVDSGIKG